MTVYPEDWVKRLEAEKDMWKRDFERAKKYSAELEAAIVVKDRFIERYARHHGDCNIYAAKIEGIQPNGGICKCGFEHDSDWMSSSITELQKAINAAVEAMELASNKIPMDFNSTTKTINAALALLKPFASGGGR